MLYTKVCWYTTCLSTKYRYSKCKRSALGQFHIIIDGLSLPRILRGLYQVVGSVLWFPGPPLTELLHPLPEASHQFC